jgi:hypothetical protein
MPERFPRLVFVCVALSCFGSSRVPADDPPTVPVKETPGLRATQVTIAIEKDRRRRQFRGTVLARKDDTLTILTAAHCMSDADENGPALLLLDHEVVEGTVLSVVRNPAYRAGQSSEIGGPDSAIARLRCRAPTSKAAIEAFGAVKPASAIAARSYPGPSGQTVAVRMIDGHGVEHAVRAGNYSNPRWLEWGLAYKPIPGDSGGGVFVINSGADGKAVPVLIGIIVGRDDKGGGASLVSKDMRWIADELPH